VIDWAGYLGVAERLLGQIPAAVWAMLVTGSLLLALVSVPLARRRARKAGEVANPDGRATRREERKERLLFAAALIPTILFLGMVMAATFRSLTAFGHDTLHWSGGAEYLVPGTLDGVGLGFSILAFRAIRKRRSPDRCVRVAWGATTASATINFAHEAGLAEGSVLGAGYLALMSLFVMILFHELLAQFEEGAEVVRDRPKFGLRWITYPYPTVCAFLAWVNHPPRAIPKTVVVHDAVRNLTRVRRAKRIAAITRVAAERQLGTPWWAPLWPWVRSAHLSAALTQANAEVAARTGELANLVVELEVLQTTSTYATEDVTALRAEVTAERLRADRVEVALEGLREAHRGEVEDLRREAAEDLEKLRAEHSAALIQANAEVAAARALASEKSNVRSISSGQKKPAVIPRGTPRLTDAEAVEEMLAEHPSPEHVWTKSQVNRITGAGWAGDRIERLMGLVAEHHRRKAEGSAADDPEELAS
jgi:hypothetical protein